MPFDTYRAPSPRPDRLPSVGMVQAVRRGLGRTCPACGEGRLFDGYLAVCPSCPVCGNDNDQYPSDDFAPYVTIFLVLHLMVPFLIAADRIWNPSVWLEAAIALPVFAIAAVAVLPYAKGGVIGFAYALGVTRRSD